MENDFWKVPGKQQEDSRIDHLLFERYLKKKKSFLANLPFNYTAIPPKIRTRMFDVFLKFKKDPGFPKWPTDFTVEKLRREWLKKQGKVSYLGFWPSGYEGAVCLTHDCDTESSFKAIKRVREIEKEYGFKSCWNFVPHKYKINFEMLKWLEKEGCEIGIHGFDHTGKIAYEDRQTIKKKLDYVKEKFKEFEIKGFRSALLQRNEEFLRQLQHHFDYDSSVPDTDIYSPKAFRNGACTAFPFFIGKMIELPLTMPQDWRLIRMKLSTEKMMEVWKVKINDILRVNGMININMHPDDFISGNEKYLKVYEELIKEISERKKLWKALPKEIAEWWRERDQAEIVKNKVKGSKRAKIISNAP
ncbi:MAG: hypothetical protein V1914_03665 [archaeon]